MRAIIAKRPIRIMSILSGIIFAVGDIFAEACIQKSSFEEFSATVYFTASLNRL
jgi:hypothetical protein